MSQREENYQNNLKPYNDGRELDGIDLDILKILVDAKFAISDIHQKMNNMEQIDRTQQLQNDINILLHIWKKKEGYI